MYTVVGDPRNRSLRVMWMLEELGQPYEIELAGAQSERMRAINPTGKAPALIAEDVAIPDSVAVITFLADRHGACTHPAGSVERALQDAATQFCVDELEGACWTAAKNRFIHPEDKRSAVDDTCAFEFELAQKRLERILGDKPFVTGETFTVPDILIVHCLNWGERMHKYAIREGAVADYRARVAARPALAAAMARGKEAVAAAA